MALVVFLRGVNVGGHRTFRPSLLVKKLSKFEMSSLGAAGTFVVRNPGSRASLQAALRAELPFVADIICCEGKEIVGLAAKDPFGPEYHGPDTVRFVTILSKKRSIAAPLPVDFPEGGRWLVRVIGVSGRFAFGAYRRDPKTVRYLGQVDKFFSVPVTTRNWNTMMSLARMLQGCGEGSRRT